MPVILKFKTYPPPPMSVSAVCVCVCVYVCAHAHVYVLRMVSMYKMLHFMNTLMFCICLQHQHAGTDLQAAASIHILHHSALPSHVARQPERAGSGVGGRLQHGLHLSPAAPGRGGWGGCGRTVQSVPMLLLCPG